MPRKRRQPKRRPPLPRGLAEISLCERATWNTSGPLIDCGDVVIDSAVFTAPRPLYHLWPSLDEWATFYETVRADLLATRPSLEGDSVAERLFLAWRDGREIDVSAGHDPRRALMGDKHAT